MKKDIKEEIDLTLEMAAYIYEDSKINHIGSLTWNNAVELATKMRKNYINKNYY